MLYKQKNPHGGDTYEKNIRLDFSANVNPYGAPAGVLRAANDSLNDISKYPDPYCRKLIRAIADYENVNADCILCGLGAAELIYAFAFAVRPKHVLEIAPGFSEYSAALETVNSKITRYTLTRDNDFALTDDFLNAFDGDDFDSVFLCTPNNPTGRLIQPELLEKIITLCHERGIRTVLDECFLDLTEKGLSISMKKMLKNCPELIILRSFTKSYGMAGLRLGYCLSADEDLLSAMSRMTQPWNIPSVTQVAGIAALTEHEFIMHTLAAISRERAYLTQELSKLGFYVCPSDANYILFHSEILLYERLYEYGIQVRDCSNYRGLGAGWVRIAVKLHEENERLIAAIRDIIRA